MSTRARSYSYLAMRALSEEVKPNKYMLLPKLSYFLAYVSFGTLQSCLPLFLKTIGLHPSEVGYTNALRCVALAFAPGFWGLLADKAQCHRFVVIVLSLVSTLTLIPQPWVANYLYKGIPETKLSNGNITAGTDIEPTRVNVIATLMDNTSAYALNQDPPIGSINMTFPMFNASYARSTKDDYQQTYPNQEEDRKILFLVLLVWNFIAAIFYSPFLNFLVTIINKTVETCKIKTNVGKQLRFGPIGYSFGVLITTIAAREFAILNLPLSTYTPLFFVVCISYIGLCVSSFFVFRRKQKPLPACKEEKESLKSEESAKSNIKGKLLQSFKNGYIIFFLTWVFCYGACSVMKVGFLFILLSEMNAPPIVLGLTTLVDEGLTIFVFPFTQKIISYIGGELQGMALTTLLMAIKMLLMSLVHTPVIVLLYLALTCASFPLLLTVMIRFIHSQVDHNIETTMMGVAYGVYYGIGAMVGSFISGIMFEKFGGRSLFRIGSGIMGFWTVLILLVLAYRGNPKKTFNKCCRKVSRLRNFSISSFSSSASSAKSCSGEEKPFTP